MHDIHAPAASADLSALSNATLESQIATCAATLDAAEHRLLTLILEFDGAASVIPRCVR